MPVALPVLPAPVARPTAARAASPVVPRVASFPDSPGPRRFSWHSSLALALVVLVAVAAAGCLYRQFLRVDRNLWVTPLHDRNAHYLSILKLATSLQQGKLLTVLDLLNGARIWPPLFNILGAAAVLAGGRDYRLAILPSMLGWVMAVVFGFLAARRSVRQGGNLAGLVTALFILASPAHRAFALDIMLESLGAGLSLAVLYCYLVAVQQPVRRVQAGRWLGIALTALFVEKYNYWLLVVLALLASELVAHPEAFCAWARTGMSRVDGRAFLHWLVREPLLLAAGAVSLFSFAVLLRGDRPFEVAGHSVSLFPPHSLVSIAYLLLFLPLLSWWRRSGRQWIGQLDPLVAALVRWHGYFLACWFLLPKHLSFFLLYISPSNGHPDQHFQLLQGLGQYAQWLMEDYHQGLASALLAAALAMAGALGGKSLRAGGRVGLLFFGLSLVLAVSHPNHKGRNLHSWMAAGWLVAGIGAAALVHGRLLARWPGLRPCLAVSVLLVLAWMTLPGTGIPVHAREGGPNLQKASWLAVTDAYLDELDGPHRSTILTAVAIKPQTQWTYLERYGRFDRLEEHWWGFGEPGPDNRAGFRRWLATTSCDTVVYLARLPGYFTPEQGPETALHAELEDVLPAQQRFQLYRQEDIPRLGARVQVWRRAGGEREAQGFSSSR